MTGLERKLVLLADLLQHISEKATGKKSELVATIKDENLEEEENKKKKKEPT